MTKQIQRVSLVQNAKTMSVLYLVLSAPMVAILLAVASVTGQAGMYVAAMMAFPLLYAASGFVFTLIGAWIYNLVASMVGGFEFTTKEVSIK